MVKDTKVKILDAAEELFSKNGINTTSLRNIMTKAHVNIAAIHYHFGSRDEVIKAVYRRRILPVNELRLLKLGALEREYCDQIIPVKKIIEAFVSPVFDYTNKNKHREVIKGLIARGFAEQENLQCLHKEFDDVFKRFTAAFSKSLPNFSMEEVCTRFTITIGVLSSAFIGSHTSTDGMNSQFDSETTARRLINYASAGFVTQLEVINDK